MSFAQFVVRSPPNQFNSCRSAGESLPPARYVWLPSSVSGERSELDTSALASMSGPQSKLVLGQPCAIRSNAIDTRRFKRNTRALVLGTVENEPQGTTTLRFDKCRNHTTPTSSIERNLMAAGGRRDPHGNNPYEPDRTSVRVRTLPLVPNTGIRSKAIGAGAKPE